MKASPTHFFALLACLQLSSCSDDALLSPGERCEFDDECAPPEDGVAVCDNKTDVCIQFHFPAEGEPCGGTFRAFTSGHAMSFTTPESDLLCYLNDGLYCDGEKCSAVSAFGEACSGTMSCEVGTYCDETCKARKSAGEACSRSEECSTEICLNQVCTTF